MAKAPKALSWPNGLAVLRLCLGMTLLFTAFQEVQNLAPQNIKDVGLGNLGFYALAAFYACLFMSNQAAPCVLSKLGATAVPVAALGYVIFIITMLGVPDLHRRGAKHLKGGWMSQDLAVILTLLLSVLGGIVGGVLWAAQGYVLTSYAPKELLNWYLSFFSLCFCSSGFIGPAVVSAVLRITTDPLAPSLVLMMLAVFGLLLLFGLPAAAGEPGKSSPLTHLREAGARRLAFLALAEGWCLNAWTSNVLPLVTKTANFQEFYQVVLLFNGLGNIVASLSYAPLADRCGRRWVLGFQSMTCVVAALLCALVLWGNCKPVELTGSFLAGFTVLLARTNNSAICADRYRGNAGSAFALLAMCRFIGTIAGMILMPLTISFAAGRTLVVCSLVWLSAASILAAFHQDLHLPILGQGDPHAHCEEAV